MCLITDVFSGIVFVPYNGRSKKLEKISNFWPTFDQFLTNFGPTLAIFAHLWPLVTIFDLFWPFLTNFWQTFDQFLIYDQTNEKWVTLITDAPITDDVPYNGRFFKAPTVRYKAQGVYDIFYNK